MKKTVATGEMVGALVRKHRGAVPYGASPDG